MAGQKRETTYQVRGKKTQLGEGVYLNKWATQKRVFLKEWGGVQDCKGGETTPEGYPAPFKK